jgi:Uncharacterized protein conserved in bacteria
MSYTVIYDGECNLCSNLVQVLETLDRGHRFRYVPMQDQETLGQWQITPADCEQGMILICDGDPQQRWQGSEAAEEIARQLPAGAPFIQAYRSIPGLKHLGDQGYEQIRDHRYDWFGRRSQVYRSPYSGSCSSC